MSDPLNTDAPAPLSPNADRERELADGILDRTTGEQYNPESPEIVAEQRARFEAANAQLKDVHGQLEQGILPVMERVKAEADAAADLPEHQAMVEHQVAHDVHDPKAHSAGKEHRSVLAEASEDSIVQNLADARPDPHDPHKPIMPVQSDSGRKDR